MSQRQGIRLSYGLYLGRTGHNPPRGLSDWWVVMIANAVGTNGLKCLEIDQTGIEYSQDILI
jgi:hypothetical protein